MKSKQSAFIWVLAANDNVGSVVGNDVEADSVCKLRGATSGNVVVRSAIPHGHKVALRAIERGALVFKYGVPIGRTTDAIPIGEHVHIQNMESLRGRGDLVTPPDAPRSKLNSPPICQGIGNRALRSGR